jgi:hypothetical protein
MDWMLWVLAVFGVSLGASILIGSVIRWGVGE